MVRRGSTVRVRQRAFAKAPQNRGFPCEAMSSRRGVSRTVGKRLMVMTPPTITPLLVAELLVEGERWPVYVHVIDHPADRVLVDIGMTELHPEVAGLDARLVPLSEQAFDLAAARARPPAGRGASAGWSRGTARRRRKSPRSASVRGARTRVSRQTPRCRSPDGSDDPRGIR